MNKDIVRQLKEAFSISDEQWRECVREHETSGRSLVNIIVAKGAAEEALLRFLSEHLDVSFMRIRSEDVDVNLAQKIPAKFVTHYNVMPLKREGETIFMGVNDPFALCAFDELKMVLKQDITPVLAIQKDITESIKEFYGLGADTLEKIAVEYPELDVTKAADDEDIVNEAIDPSVIKFLNQVLLDAIKQRATDIHVEPFEDDLRIRYRIDGMLHEVSCPPTIKHFQSSIVSRIKVMASLDIAEKRRPQDGRIKIKMAEDVFDLRISILPAPFGESIVIRILSRTSPVIGLEKLGLRADGLAILDRMIQKPHGIILVTGPTGSGKTTTLYACLSKINSPHRKILTIEEPIEYQLKGITQMQVEPKIGFTFATALRSMLRHDPDVMMVGEIRDKETANLAVRTALTGHLVFSTLHTNDAASSITRLLDMGIDSFLAASSVILIIAQRLVRLVCPHCKETYVPDSEISKQFDFAIPEKVTFYRGKGCEQCRFTGYHGRTAIFEILEPNDEIREMTLKKLPAHQIKQEAVSGGMKVLRQAGMDKVKEGLTTLEEVLRVTQEEKI